MELSPKAAKFSVTRSTSSAHDLYSKSFDAIGLAYAS